MPHQEHVNVLVALADTSIAEPVSKTLRSMGHACTVEASHEEALIKVRSGKFDIIVLDVDFGGENRSLEILDAVRNSAPEVQVILISDKKAAATAVKAMNRGAAHYLQMPVNYNELSFVVGLASKNVVLQRENESLHQELAQNYGMENIIGESLPMRKVFHRIRQAAATDATVLILGETGTGKELVARAIHFNGPRKKNRFVPLNCAGLVETILESELFGHEKGAFTGATSSRVGMFEHANSGTLFLDEIGDMPQSSQVKLLRVLEQNEIVRVGSNETIKIDVRVIAATHQNLLERVEDGSFRKDLFYRLNVVTINLPPLRERREDILVLTDHFLRELAEKYGIETPQVSQEVKKFLYRYEWPGNVRELRNCLEQMVVLANDNVIAETEMPDYLFDRMKLQPPGHSMDALAGQPLEDIERVHIDRTLKLVNGNREKAADLLGIGERTLYRKIRKYELD